MKSDKRVIRVLCRITADKRVTAWHISLCIAILIQWKLSGYIIPLKITRAELMALAKFKSITTYHKCIKHLQEYGYVNYVPTYDSLTGSSIEILN